MWRMWSWKLHRMQRTPSPQSPPSLRVCKRLCSLTALPALWHPWTLLKPRWTRLPPMCNPKCLSTRRLTSKSSKSCKKTSPPPPGFVSRPDSVSRAPSFCVCFVFFSAIWYYVWCLILCVFSLAILVWFKLLLLLQSGMWFFCCFLLQSGVQFCVFGPAIV